MLLPNNVAIISAEKADLSEEDNTLRNEVLRKMLVRDSIPHWPVIGQYEGKAERSFMVQTDLSLALYLGSIFYQDSVLWLDGADTGLYYMEGHHHPGDSGAISYDGPETDYYSIVVYKGKLVKFAVPIDFDVKVPTNVKPVYPLRH